MNQKGVWLPEQLNIDMHGQTSFSLPLFPFLLSTVPSPLSMHFLSHLSPYHLLNYLLQLLFITIVSLLSPSVSLVHSLYPSLVPLSSVNFLPSFLPSRYLHSQPLSFILFFHYLFLLCPSVDLLPLSHSFISASFLPWLCLLCLASNFSSLSPPPFTLHYFSLYVPCCPHTLSSLITHCLLSSWDSLFYFTPPTLFSSPLSHSVSLFHHVFFLPTPPISFIPPLQLFAPTPDYTPPLLTVLLILKPYLFSLL